MRHQYCVLWILFLSFCAAERACVCHNSVVNSVNGVNRQAKWPRNWIGQRNALTWYTHLVIYLLRLSTLFHSPKSIHFTSTDHLYFSIIEIRISIKTRRLHWNVRIRKKSTSWRSRIFNLNKYNYKLIRGQWFINDSHSQSIENLFLLCISQTCF